MEETVIYAMSVIINKVLIDKEAIRLRITLIL